MPQKRKRCSAPAAGTMTRPVAGASRTPEANPDVRVPEKTTREDGLCARGAQEVENADTEEPEKGDAENESEDGNSGVPLQTDDQPWEKNNTAKHDIRHVPGGTWLTKGHLGAYEEYLQEGTCERVRRDIP
ncbi:hypothetical protein NDU88_003279 [Pleurodeles waltl]|uniref:Uncharacterized protein n=1 Tax=Pleurodeles waltl TaxID=8319 RepID=A0AAV7M8C7_PLEWA|nr:hypothetical protein NDU88_003279 [Pleurodeles waltl]